MSVVVKDITNNVIFVSNEKILDNNDLKVKIFLDKKNYRFFPPFIKISKDYIIEHIHDRVYRDYLETNTEDSNIHNFITINLPIYQYEYGKDLDKNLLVFILKDVIGNIYSTDSYFDKDYHRIHEHIQDTLAEYENKKGARYDIQALKFTGKITDNEPQIDIEHIVENLDLPEIKVIFYRENETRYLLKYNKNENVLDVLNFIKSDKFFASPKGAMILLDDNDDYKLILYLYRNNEYGVYLKYKKYTETGITYDKIDDIKIKLIDRVLGYIRYMFLRENYNIENDKNISITKIMSSVFYMKKYDSAVLKKYLIQQKIQFERKTDNITVFFENKNIKCIIKPYKLIKKSIKVDGVMVVFYNAFTENNHNRYSIFVNTVINLLKDAKQYDRLYTKVIRNKFNIDFKARLCQTNRQPAIVKAGETSIYTIKVNETVFGCIRNKKFPYPGITSTNQPCCFKKDQRNKTVFKNFFTTKIFTKKFKIKKTNEILNPDEISNLQSIYKLFNLPGYEHYRLGVENNKCILGVFSILFKIEMKTLQYNLVGYLTNDIYTSLNNGDISLLSPIADYTSHILSKENKHHKNFIHLLSLYFNINIYILDKDTNTIIFPNDVLLKDVSYFDKNVFIIYYNSLNIYEVVVWGKDGIYDFKYDIQLPRNERKTYLPTYRDILKYEVVNHIGAYSQIVHRNMNIGIMLNNETYIPLEPMGKIIGVPSITEFKVNPIEQKKLIMYLGDINSSFIDYYNLTYTVFNSNEINNLLSSYILNKSPRETITLNALYEDFCIYLGNRCKDKQYKQYLVNLRNKRQLRPVIKELMEQTNKLEKTSKEMNFLIDKILFNISDNNDIIDGKVRKKFKSVYKDLFVVIDGKDNVMEFADKVKTVNNF